MSFFGSATVTLPPFRVAVFFSTVFLPFFTTTVTLPVAVVPWAGSWASAGHEYVVVQADIRPYPLEIHRGTSYARYDVRTITDQSTVDGATASQPFQQDSSARYVVGGTSVFEVATGTHTLDLKLAYALQRGGQTGSGKYPLDPTVTFTRSVPLS